MSEWLAHRAFVLPDHPAVVFGDETLIYAELEARTVALASELRAADVAPGDRVALLALNSIEFVVAVHAILRAGAILLPLNARLTPNELAFQLEDAGAHLLLHHAQTTGLATAATALSRTPRLDLDTPLSAKHSALSTSPSSGLGTRDSGLAIIYTSGTTGTPKGALLTYDNFFASAAASAFNMGVLPDDRWVACLPMFHIGGLSIVTRSAIYGTTVVVHPTFDEHEVNRELRERGATLLSVVPTMLQRMLDADDLPYPPTVRGVLVGGGPVTKDLLLRARDRGLPVLQTYGLTEGTSQITTLSPADALSHPGSAGKPLLGTDIRIDAPAGEPGEILVQGPTVMAHYWNKPEATERALGDAWLHTGDVGYLDADGFLYVLDRRDDLIVTGGENVYPAEVEGAARSCAGVLDCAIVGVTDARWGQVVAAAVVAAPGFEQTAFETQLRARLAGYKLPRVIRIVDALPVTASGKVRRNVVREWFAK